TDGDRAATLAQGDEIVAIGDIDGQRRRIATMRYDATLSVDDENGIDLADVAIEPRQEIVKRGRIGRVRLRRQIVLDAAKDQAIELHGGRRLLLDDRSGLGGALARFLDEDRMAAPGGDGKEQDWHQNSGGDERA